MLQNSDSKNSKERFGKSLGSFSYKTDTHTQNQSVRFILKQTFRLNLIEYEISLVWFIIAVLAQAKTFRDIVVYCIVISNILHSKLPKWISKFTYR